MAQQTQERPLHALDPHVDRVLARHGMKCTPPPRGTRYIAARERDIVARGALIECWGPQASAADYVPTEAELIAGEAELDWVAGVIAGVTEGESNKYFSRVATRGTITTLSWLHRNSRDHAAASEVAAGVRRLIEAVDEPRYESRLKDVLGTLGPCAAGRAATDPHGPVAEQARLLASRLNGASTKKKPLIVLEDDADRPENSAVVKEWDLPPVGALLPEELGLALPEGPAPTGSADDSIAGMLRQVLANQELIIAGLGLRR